MAYNFKNLADVELLNAMPEEANVVVEVNGTTKRAPLPEIPEVDVTAELIGSEALEEVPDGATVLAEVNGEIKRVPSAGLGGAGMLIIRHDMSEGTANMSYDEVRSAAFDNNLPFCCVIGGYLYDGEMVTRVQVPSEVIAREDYIWFDLDREEVYFNSDGQIGYYSKD
jgi:hypothetical protein